MGKGPGLALVFQLDALVIPWISLHSAALVPTWSKTPPDGHLKFQRYLDVRLHGQGEAQRGVATAVNVDVWRWDH